MLQTSDQVVNGLYQEEYASMAAALDAGAAAGWLRPVISEEFPLSSTAEAQREVIEHKQGSCGKIILSVWGTSEILNTNSTHADVQREVFDTQGLEMKNCLQSLPRTNDSF